MLYSPTQIDLYCCAILDRVLHNNKSMYPLFRVLYDTGCRFSDIINSYSCSYAGTSFSYYPAKKNNLRTINFSDVIPLYADFVRGVDSFYFRYSYSSALRCFRMNLFPSQLRCGDKAVDLHLFRHNKLKQLHQAGYSVSEIKAYIGHIAESQTMRYILSEIHD